MAFSSPSDYGFYYDPLYGYVPLKPLFRRALNLKTVQRLRRMKQLATLDLIFPGATHTRFAHSVGVFYVTSRIVDRLFDLQWERPNDIPPIGPEHIAATQLAALFHDVGHGPFSHIFELFCRRQGAYVNWSHESVSQKLISEGLTGFTDIPDFLRKEAATWRRESKPGDPKWLDPDNIAAMSQGLYPLADKKYLFLSQIVKSSFDADRMDYLRRDAYYTGVETGRVDIWEIIDNITVVLEKPGDDVFTLRINKGAAASVEAFLSARDLTYRRVYYNRNHMANQELLIRAFRELVDKYRPEELVMKTDEEMFEVFDDFNPLTKNVSERLKGRILYELLPFNINVYNDLRGASKQRWADLRSVNRKEIFSSEEKLAQDLSLKEGERIIFEMEQIPLAKRADYYDKYLLDPETGQSLSLIEVLPHLLLTRGSMVGIRGVTTEDDVGEIYLNLLTDISVFVPPEVVIGFAQGIIKILKQMPPPLQNEDIRKQVRREIAKEVCPFKMIFNSLTSLLDFSPKDAAHLWERCAESSSQYMDQIVFEMIQSSAA